MGTLTRLSDFETDRDAVPPVLISATKMDAELDQIVTESNAQDVRLDAQEAAGNVSTADLADDAVDGDKIADNAIDSEHYTDGSIDNAHIADDAIDSEHYADGSIDNAHIADNAIDSEHYADGSIDTAHIAADAIDGTLIADNAIDSEHYTDASIDSAHIGADQVITAKILDSNVTLPKIVDASATNKVLGRVATGSGNWEEVTLETTLSSTDEAIPTSKAVRDDIVSLVNDVGGFVAIATEVVFPNANPDPDDGAGTVVSIANVGGLVVNGSGVSTTGRTVGGATVTINSISSTYYSTTIADGLGMQVVSTAVLNTYNYHKIIAKEGDTNIVATNIADVNTLAASAVVTDMALLAESAVIADMALLADSAIITDMALLGDSAVIADMALLAIPAVITDMDLLGASGVIDDMETVANGISNINIVAGELVYTEDLGSVADAVTTSSGNDITVVAAAITNINTTATAIANVNLVGAAIANVNLTGGSIANVNTVATNIAGVTSFAERYRVGSSNPASSLDEGDLFFNTSDNALKYYNGSSWASITAGIGSVEDDTSPTLGGTLDADGENITNCGTISGANLQMDFGSVA
tara:strand:- start:207 stop:1970 length:1764 start_codon:yes stop_codon:yes gene_type:complete